MPLPLTGSALCEAILAEAEAAAQAERDQGLPAPPSMEQQHAAKMLVDGFGLAATEQPTPVMEQLYEQFVNVKQGGARVKSVLERSGITPRRFQMARDWDPEELEKYNEEVRHRNNGGR